MKRIAILQSNYLPWKGYFDLIAAVDEFVLLDDVQFTKNDWRNRNLIKTPQGVQWLSVPVGQDIHRRIRDVELKSHCQERHWKTLECNYRRADHFAEIAAWLEPLYRARTHRDLSSLNRCFIEAICRYLGITTRIHDSAEYPLCEGRSQRLVELCTRLGAGEYVTGPAARAYLDTAAFAGRDIRVRWFDYDGYPPYRQLWGEFVHQVSIVDLLFNCGPESVRYMRYVAR